MIAVHINGARLVPKHDYNIAKERIRFSQAPRYGDLIQLATPTSTCQFYGNDVQMDYPIPDSLKKSVGLEQLISDLLEYMDHPTVKDQLERLQVVLELVKNPPKTD
jgi:hypothetical protein